MILERKTSMAYVEVLAIIKKLSKKDFEKIPKQLIDLYEEYKDKEYIFNYNKSKSLEEQISEETKPILANLFEKYIATEEEKMQINEKDKREIAKIEKQKSEIKLNPLFQKKQDKVNANISTELAISKVDNNNFFQKIILKIKAFFWRNKK